MVSASTGTNPASIQAHRNVALLVLHLMRYMGEDTTPSSSLKSDSDAHLQTHRTVGL
jgi:hypothetical protein